MARFISNVRYASDEEWSRFIILNLICCSGLTGFNLAEYFDWLNSFDYLNKTLKINYCSATNCIVFFNFNLWANFINMVSITTVCAVQFVMIFLNFNVFFIQKTDMSISYDDKDIAVYT